MKKLNLFKNCVAVTTFLILIASTSYAQLKTGNNPTTLGTDANFQVEGNTTSDQFIVLKNGNVGIGTITPSARLDLRGLGSDNSIAVGSTTQSASTAGAGAIRYNSTLGQLEYSNGTTWIALVAGNAPIYIQIKNNIDQIITSIGTKVLFQSTITQGGSPISYNTSTGDIFLPAGRTFRLDFNPGIAATKSVKVTEASTFEAGATLKKVLVHVHDVDGNQKHDVIKAAAGTVTIDLSGLNLAGISFTATVICDKGCKADLGVYNLTGKSETGDFANSAKQGKNVVMVAIVFQLVISYLENLGNLGYKEAKGIAGIVLRRYNK
jgi:hypothetical protein